MPYSIQRSAKGWKVTSDLDGKTLGNHLTKGKAERQVRAVLRSEEERKWKTHNFKT